MKRTLARPHEMARVDSLERRIAGLGEAQRCPPALAPLHVRSLRRGEVQVVAMKAEDAKEAAEPRQVAAYHALEVRHAPEPPVLEIGSGQPPSRTITSTGATTLLLARIAATALYLWVHRIAAERIDRHPRLAPGHMPALILSSSGGPIGSAGVVQAATLPSLSTARGQPLHRVTAGGTELRESLS